MSLNKNFKNALQQLKSRNFPAYIVALAALGIDISNELGIASIKKLAAKVEENKTALSQFPLNLLEQLRENCTDEELLQICLAAAMFASSWSKPPADADATHKLIYHAKQNFNISTRHQIHLGMLAFADLLDILATEKIFNLTENHINELLDATKKIYQAISTYETKQQEIVRYVSKALAIITSIAFGLLETSVAIFFVGMACLAPTSWIALSGLLAVSALFGGVVSYVSYCMLRDDTSSVFQEVAGKDRFLQGFLQYKNELGKDVDFSKKQIAALAMFTILLALPTSIATGAVAFTSTMSIPTILALFGMTVTSSLFPILGIIFAVTITATMTLFVVKSFHTFIAVHHGNPISFIRQPFDDINQMLDEMFNVRERPIANIVAKTLAHTVNGLICAMGIAGLVVASLSGANSVTALVSKLFKAPLIVSAAIGVAVGGVLSFASRSFQTVAKCGSAVVKLFKLAAHQSKAKIDKLGLLTGILLDLPLMAFFWIDAFLRPPAASPILPMPTGIKAIALATTCTTVRDAGLVIDSMFTNKETVKTNEATEKNHIVAVANQITSNKTIVKHPLALQRFSFFKNKLGSTNTTNTAHSEKFLPAPHI